MTTDLKTLAERVEALQAPCRETDALVCAALKYINGEAHQMRGEWTARGPLVDIENGPLPIVAVSDPLTSSLDAVLALIGGKLPGQQVGILEEAISHLRLPDPPSTSDLARFALAATLRAIDEAANAADRATRIRALKDALRALGESHDR